MSVKLRMLLLAALGLLFTAVTALPTRAEESQLDAKLSAATNALVEGIKKSNPEGRAYTIAAAPLVEPGETRQRRLNSVVAEVISRQMTNPRPEWLTVVDRISLPSVLTEQKLWIYDLVKQEKKGNPTPEGLLERADLLVVGTQAVAGNELKIELRAVLSRSAQVITAEGVQITLTPVERSLLQYVQRSEAGGTEDVARVSAIKLELTAQRPVSIGGDHREWVVRDGETLQSQIRQGETVARKGDQFNIRFETDADACVYVFLIGPDGKAALLFPTKDWEAHAADNYCRAEWPCFAPGPGKDGLQRFYTLDDATGRNVLYVAAHRSDVRNIDGVRQRLEQARSSEERVSILEKVFDYWQKLEFSQE